MFSFIKKKQDNNLYAFLSGKVVPISEVDDEVFASKSLGDGIGIMPTDNILCSPANGEIIFIGEDSWHALVIKLANGMEIMLHIGIDTINMKGDGFSCLVNVGDKVKKGQNLISFDAKKITQAGYSLMTMLVVLKEGDAKNIRFNTKNNVITNIDIISTYE